MFKDCLSTSSVLVMSVSGLYRVTVGDRVQWLQDGGQDQTVSTCGYTSSGGRQDQEEMGMAAYTKSLGPHKTLLTSPPTFPSSLTPSTDLIKHICIHCYRNFKVNYGVWGHSDLRRCLYKWGPG